MHGNEEFAVVFVAMGIRHDDAEFFRRSFDESGALSNTAMFLNLADDPPMERIIAPRAALTLAEFLAFERDMHVLVIMTDMTNYGEALRELASQRGEIPSRKGYPGYLYSDLASMYERTGIIQGRKGVDYSGADPDNAQRRHQPPHAGPDRLYHRGANGVEPRPSSVAACIRRSTCCLRCRA